MAQSLNSYNPIPMFSELKYLKKQVTDHPTCRTATSFILSSAPQRGYDSSKCEELAVNESSVQVIRR
ncbi:hypothetical protein EYZ11_011489 [Aspergillus tanneri]|uniref:Uncharacterized protein n=1 Tax=Aspergillus tanneri TaxID=1220188 RepID=A0A4S3J3A7_9EURO|nr:hypothetical protein EYZ11_011489 [Aspergillus tanneri]